MIWFARAAFVCKHPLIPTVKFPVLRPAYHKASIRTRPVDILLIICRLALCCWVKWYSPFFPVVYKVYKNRLSISSTSLTLSAINFYTDAVLKVAVRAPTFAPLVVFFFLLMRRGKIPAGWMQAVGGAERFIFAELESNVFITQFTAEHSKGHSGRES